MITNSFMYLFLRDFDSFIFIVSAAVHFFRGCYCCYYHRNWNYYWCGWYAHLLFWYLEAHFSPRLKLSSVLCCFDLNCLYSFRPSGIWQMKVSSLNSFRCSVCKFKVNWWCSLIDYWPILVPYFSLPVSNTFLGVRE